MVESVTDHVGWKNGTWHFKFGAKLATLIWRVAALAVPVRGLIRQLPERPGKMEKSRKTHIKLPALKRSEFPWACDDTPYLLETTLNNIAVSFGKLEGSGEHVLLS